MENMCLFAKKNWLAVFVSIFAIAIFIARPHVEWVTKATDSIGIMLLGLAMLPWLGSILESFSITGFGEAKFRKIERLEQRLENAEEAIDNSREIQISQETLTKHIDQNEEPKGRLKRLADEYVSTRKSMPSGNERTEQMAAIFAQMRLESKRIGKSKFDPSIDLKSNDSGKNLAAIAYAYTFADDFSIDEMIELIRRSKQPFVQFWGLRSIQNAVSAAGLKPFSIKNIEDLRDLENSIKPRTDRAYTIGRIVKGLNRLLEAS